MTCRFRIDLPGLFGFGLYPSQDLCVQETLGRGSLRLTLSPPTDFFDPRFSLPLQIPLRLPNPFQARESWTGILRREERDASPYRISLRGSADRPVISLADLYPVPDTILRGALEAASPATPTSRSALTEGLSNRESPWVPVMMDLFGRLLASADIRIAGVPANGAVDGLVEGVDARDEMRCRYTEFRGNHFFPEIVHEGEPYHPSCNDAEYSHRPECDPGPRQICLAPETRATVRILVREVEGRSESIVNHLAFIYDRNPHVLMERIPVLRDILPMLRSLPALLLRGFFANDPSGARSHCRSTLDETICEGRSGPTPLGDRVPPPARPYFLLQYSFEDPLPHPLSERVDRASEAGALPYSSGGLAPSVPLLEFSFDRGLERSPIQQLVTAATRAFNQDMLEGWLEDFGLNGLERERYDELGIPVGGIPRSVLDFMRLMRPLFTQETRERLNRQARTWNPNVTLDHSPLFLWSQTRELEINGLLRRGELTLPGAIRLRLTDLSNLRRDLAQDRAALSLLPGSPEDEEQRLTRRDLEFQEAFYRRHSVPSAVNRIEIRGNESEILTSLIGAALPEIDIPLSSTPGGDTTTLSLRRIYADRLSVEFPSLSDLFHETPIDPRPLRSIALENPYLQSLRIHSGSIELILRNVRAERIEYRLPSTREIRERHLTPEQYFTQGQWIIRGLRADSLIISNPRYDLWVEIRNLQGEITGRSRRTATSDAQSISFPITRLAAESIRVSMGGVGVVSAENTELSDLDFSLRPDRLTARAERIFSRASMEYQGIGSRSGTHIQLTGETTLSDLRLQIDHPSEGPLQGQVDFGISADVGAGSLNLGSSGSIRLTQGSIRNGSFHSEFQIPTEPESGSRFLNQLQGDLRAEVERVDHFRSDFNIPGFFFDGSLENFRLQGSARITYGHDRWAIERPEASLGPLSLEAIIRETQVHHDPRVTDLAIRRIPFSEVAQTEAIIHRARVHIDDFVRWASLPDEATLGSTLARDNRLEVDFRGLRVSEIQSSGEIWSALPPWRYLRGILSLGGSFLPLQRGRSPRALPPGGDCRLIPGGIPPGIDPSENFIYLGEWRARPTGPGRTESRLRDLRTCLRSEPIDTSGSRPFVILGIPELGIHRGSRPAVSSGDQPIHFDACLLDLRRGGWICMSPAPRR